MLLQIEEEEQEEQQEKERERGRGRVNLVDNRDKDKCTISNWFNGFFFSTTRYISRIKPKPNLDKNKLIFGLQLLVNCAVCGS